MIFDAQHRKPRRIVLLLLAGIALGALALAADPQPQRVRLELASGSMVVLGPVEARNGQLFFRTLEGRLASVPEKLVRRSVPLGPEESPTGTGGSRGTSTSEPRTLTNQDLPADAAPADDAERFTNADLTDVAPPSDGRTYTNAELPVIEESEPAPEEPADAVEGDEPAPGDAPPASEDAARIAAEIEELDARITLAEQEESLYFRLLVCAQNGIPLNGKDCHPDLGLEPKPSASPSPAERSLLGKMEAAQRQAQEAREERERLVEEAGGADGKLPTVDSEPGRER
jgi:hypothetical protein